MRIRRAAGVMGDAAEILGGEMRAAHLFRRISGTAIVAVVATAALVGGGAVVAAPAVAAPTYTKAWQGEDSGAPEPDPGSGDEGSAVFRFENPDSFVVEPGTTVTIPFDVSCWDARNEEQTLYFSFHSVFTQDAVEEVGTGTWTGTPGGLETYSGQIQFVMPETGLEVGLYATGAYCVTANEWEDDLYERVFAFTTPQEEDPCDALPGEPIDLEEGGPAVEVMNPTQGYTTFWDVESNATVADVTGIDSTSTQLQYDAYDGFSYSLDRVGGEGDNAELADCVSRAEFTPEDWGYGTYGDLRLETQNYYFPSGDLVRRVWTFSNDSGQEVPSSTVRIRSTFGAVDNTFIEASASWGAVFSDTSDAGYTPIVTQLWGGPDVTLQGDMRPAADLATNPTEAVDQSTDWLDAAAEFSGDYLDGVKYPLNWGPNAVTPTTEMDPRTGDLYTTYELPALGDRSNISIVEFAHVQYWANHDGDGDGGGDGGGDPDPGTDLPPVPMTGVGLGMTIGESYTDASPVAVGLDLAPNSDWRAVLQPGDIPLASGTTDENGEFREVLQLPDDLAAGTYRIVVTGLSVDGETVVTGEDWFTIDALGIVTDLWKDGTPDPTTGDPAPAGAVAGAGGVLASTGVEGALPGALLSMLLLAAGGLFLVRRRIAAQR